jgi:hypothetical protein
MPRLRFLPVVLCLLLATFASASTPSSGTINQPADDTLGVKQTFSYFGGPLAATTGFSNYSLPVCLQAVTPPGVCDVYSLRVNLPANYYDTHHSKLTVTLTWNAEAGMDPSLNDIDLYIVDSAGNDLGHGADTNAAAAGGTGMAKEVAFTGDIPAGNYRIVVIDSLAAAVTTRFDVTVTFELTAPPTPPPATAQIFTHYQPPVPATGSRLGTGAGEPSIGVNWKTGNVMYQSNTQTLRIRFDDAVKPATATWENVAAPITSVRTLDPILYTDLKTGRTFVSQLYLACSLLAFTDDDGVNWFQNPVGCGPTTVFDHQTVGGGVFAAGASANDPLFNYKNSVIYCAHDDVTGACATSTDGGVTFPNFAFVWNITECGTIHGHVRVGPDGYQYLPNHRCGENQALGISADNGKTWTISKIPGSTPGNFDPWVDIGPKGTIYFGYTDGNGHAYVAVSRDHGANWSAPFDVGAAQNVQNSEFASVVVGDDDRAAIAFLGTTTAGNDQASTFTGAWNLYVAMTYDGGATWTTYNTTPGDPVQRGCIWAGGGSNACRNLLDFMGITMDKVGRVLVGYADGCIDDPQNAANRCVTAPPENVADTVRTKLASVARQTAGVGLLAQYDGVISTVPYSPVLSGLADNSVNHLSWTVPTNGGAPITGYKLYRGTAPSGETLLTSVGASTTSYNDNAVSNGTTYYYRVAAVNAIGTGSTSNEVALTPAVKAAPSAPRKLKARGSHEGVSLTWWTPSSSGTAAITNYKVYRGIAPGTGTFLADAGNQTQFVDTTAQSGVTYYYTVTAVNAVGESPRSNEDSAQRK